MKKHKMDIVDSLIDELIDLSDTKYGLVKIGKDTLNLDIVFIEKYEELKKIIKEENMKYPSKMKVLQNLIKDIDEISIKKDNRNLRMKKATNAYKK